MNKFSLSPFALRFSVALLIATTLSGLGARWGWWHFRTGFAILRFSAYGGLAAAAVALLALAMERKIRLQALAALSIGAAVAAIPWCWMRTAKRVPPIHDISTDTENPPLFVAVLSLRKDASNPAEYGGQEVSAQQKAAYPDLAPLVLPVPSDQAFLQAQTAARKMGWEIVDINESNLHFEATDTTLWFGFKDDVAVRVAPVPEGSRSDVRSLSRVGKSDVGTNARRIRKYLKLLKQA